MDEPSMGLDPKSRRTVFETIRTLNDGGRTVLLVEQNARAGLAIAHHGAVMDAGSSARGAQRGSAAGPARRGALPRRRSGLDECGVGRRRTAHVLGLRAAGTAARHAAGISDS